MRSPPPETIGRFRIEARLGSGGMGDVYKAFDPTLRRTVAVKTVRPDISIKDHVGRLLREAQACASLQHPHIVTVFEAGELDGAVYIVMEHLEGEDLSQVLHRGELTFEERIRTLIQVLDALEHAHAKGVIHRDIKPGNVRVLPNQTIKLVDFGIARLAAADALTKTGTIIGTPNYASPEQLRGETVDKRTDIYSVGAMAYELCSGRRPFQGPDDSLTTVILKAVFEPPPPMDVEWSRSFPEIERIVHRAMAKSADDRYQSAKEMREALAAFLDASRDDIGAVHAGRAAAARRSVSEAAALLKSGQDVEAKALLTQTLALNPCAPDVSRMLNEIANTSGDGESERRTDTPAPERPAAALAPTAAAVAPTAAASTAPTRKIEPAAGTPSVTPTLAASRRSPALVWIGGVAAVAALAAIIGLARYSDAPPEDSSTVVADAPTPTPAASPADPPPEAAPTPDPSTGARESPRPTQPPAPTGAPANRAAPTPAPPTPTVASKPPGAPAGARHQCSMAPTIPPDRPPRTPRTRGPSARVCGIDSRS
jgi:serine/threonine-protein kinase